MIGWRSYVDCVVEWIIVVLALIAIALAFAACLMAGPKIDVYNIGRLGVNVDSDDLHVLDGEFRKAQNWQVEPSGASGIRRRDGMGPLTAAMAGAGAGIVGVPLPDTSALTRTFYLPYNDAAASAINWRKSSDSGVTWSNIQLGTKPQQSADLGTVGGVFAAGLMRWATLNNKVYFAGRAGRLVGVGSNPTVNVFDGLSAYVLATIPPNPNSAGGFPYGVLSIVPYSANQLIFTTSDDTTAPGGAARVFLLNINTGALQQLGPQTNLNGMLWFPFVYAGKIWIGTSNTSGGSASKVYWIRPGDTTWTLDFTSAVTEGYIYGMAAFKGDLYAGFGVDVGSSGKIKKRTTNGVWSNVHTSDGTGASNYCGPLITSLDGTAIYAFRWSVSGGAAPVGRILKSTDGAAWAQDYDAGSVAGSSMQGIPILDPNNSGDIYWCMFDPTNISPGRFVRNRAGVYTVLDTDSHFRGPISYLYL